MSLCFYVFGYAPQLGSNSKAVISLACKRIDKYTDEQVGTFFKRWCLMRIRKFLQVFVGAQTTDVRRHGF
jgi:hypothetical protein